MSFSALSDGREEIMNSFETEEINKLDSEDQYAIELNHVSFDYVDKKTKFQALNDLNLKIHRGEFVCVLGSSGCGKSTLLGLLNGLYKAKSGEILIGGREIRGPGVDRAMVFQQYSLFPWLTAKENVLFGVKQNGKKYSRKEREESALRYLGSVGLSGSSDKYPSQLSGGMQQRVAVARALALESEILLMDEPFGAIDPRLRLELQELVSKLSIENKKTVVFVTHDIDEAILLADRIVVMEPGKIRTIVKVDFPHPRIRENLIRSDTYQRLHVQLTSAFYDRLIEQIDSEVAL